MRRTSSSEKGASLISVLVIVMLMSLAALAATDSLARTVDLSRTSGFRADTFWTARGASYAAEAYLTDIIGKTGRSLTSDAELWSKDIVLPVKRGIVSASVREQSNCFNLSSLVDASEEAALKDGRFDTYKTLLAAAGINQTDADSLARKLGEWMMPNSETVRTLNNVGELASVPGYTQDVLARIGGLVCVLGVDQQPALNLNTMEVWQAPLLIGLFSPELSESEAQYLIEDRPRGGWQDLSLFQEMDSVQRIAPAARNDSAISLESTYFRVELSVQTGSGLSIYDVLYGPDEETGSVLLSMAKRDF